MCKQRQTPEKNHPLPGALALLAAAMLAVVMGNGGVARTVRLEKLDAEGGSMGAHKTHVAHAAALARTHGNKYQQELASLASSAGHNRRSALGSSRRCASAPRQQFLKSTITSLVNIHRLLKISAAEPGDVVAQAHAQDPAGTTRNGAASK